MKKKSIFVMLIIISVIFSSCGSQTAPMPNSDYLSNFTGKQDMDNNFKLIVNGKDLSFGNHVLVNREQKYAELPLLVIIKNLGCEVQWYSTKKVVIKFNNDNYILNPVKNTLFKKGDSFNIIALPPGTKHKAYYRIINNEFIIDSDCIRQFINLLGAKITIDYDNEKINITKLTG